MIRQNIEILKQQCDLAAFILADGVELIDLGQSWRGLCPFHEEKTPSFFVQKEYNRYRCWGCGAAGDIFDWLHLRKGLSFSQALDFLEGNKADFGECTETHSIDNNKFAGENQHLQQLLETDIVLKNINRNLASYYGKKLYDNWIEFEQGKIEPTIYYTNDHYYEDILIHLDQDCCSLEHKISEHRRQRAKFLSVMR